ncbi:MAG: hypothetical protein LBH31_07865, partial [Burkholderiaceae bacterium]|nr:hypothetical protein [Burkholderiaceae bacterium]
MNIRIKLAKQTLRAIRCAVVAGCGWGMAGILAGIFGVATAASAQAVNATAHIQSITGSVQGGIEMVKIDFDQPPAAIPAG